MSQSPVNVDGLARPPQDESLENSNVTATTTTTAAAAAPPQPPPPSSTKKFACVLCRRRKLKCDSAKPACGTCSRLKHDCTYQDDAPKKPPVKRRNIKDLEARLAQVEGKLTQEKLKSKINATANRDSSKFFDSNINFGGIDIDMDWSAEADPAVDPAFFTNDAFGATAFSQQDFNFGASVLPLGLQESLPPQDVMDELHDQFFKRIGNLVPMIHEARYRTALQGPPHMRPAVCLRYAIFAVTATILDKYNAYKGIFYQRARQYAEADECKGNGESFITIQHAQTWIILGNYEVRNASFPRAWMSAGRAVRLVQMMGLDRLDSKIGSLKQTLLPPRDWLELEERRRTFWGAYCGDRWASSGTGWAMNIVEDDVTTNLPSSEEAYASGVPEETLPLRSLFTAEGASRLSSFAGVVFMASLFGHNVVHMHRGHINDRPEDLKNGEFWKRHRKMDNVLATTLFALPNHMKLRNNLRDPNIVLINTNIHSSIICLHQAAITKAEEYNLGADVIKRSRLRCIVAADEIVNIMRLCSHIDLTDMNPWICFSLYVSAQVFLENCRKLEDNADQSRGNLEFIMVTMTVIKSKHSIVNSFITQLRLDMESLGMGTAFFASQDTDSSTNEAVYTLPGRERGEEMTWRNPTLVRMAREEGQRNGKGGDSPIGSFGSYATRQFKHDYTFKTGSESSSEGALRGKMDSRRNETYNAGNTASIDGSEGASASATPSDTNETLLSGNGASSSNTSLPSRPPKSPLSSFSENMPCMMVNTAMSMYPKRNSESGTNINTPSTQSPESTRQHNFSDQAPDYTQQQSSFPDLSSETFSHQQQLNANTHTETYQSFTIDDQQFFEPTDLSDFNFMQDDMQGNQAFENIMDPITRQFGN